MRIPAHQEDLTSSFSQTLPNTPGKPGGRGTVSVTAKVRRPPRVALALQLPDPRLSLPSHFNFSTCDSPSHLDDDSDADTDESLREHSDESLTGHSDESPVHSTFAPSFRKAERVLGTGEIPGATRHDSRTSSAVSALSLSSGERTPIAEQKTLWGIGASSQNSSLDEMFHHHRGAPNGGLQQWPGAQQNVLATGLLQQRSRMPASDAPSPIDPPQYMRHEPSNSSLRSYYESSRLPSSISQQTSDSAVRDMAWRKACPSPIAGSKSESHLPGKRLKSAMKPSSPDSQYSRGTGINMSEPKKVRRLDFAHLLVRGRNTPDPAGISSQRSNASTSSLNLLLAATSSKNKTSKKLKHDKALLLYELPAGMEMEQPPRPKVFEKDVYDTAKVHVRRPPKGIKNWFDGFDISSDEEEIQMQSPVELPASEPTPEPEREYIEALPSTFSPYPEMKFPSGPQIPAGLVPTRKSSQVLPRSPKSPKSPKSRPTHARRNPSEDIVYENMDAVTQARQQMHSRHAADVVINSRSKGTTSAGGVHTSHHDHQSRGAGRSSRLETSSLAHESVLITSDNSEDDQPGVELRTPVDAPGSVYYDTISDASPTSVRRTPSAARHLRSSRSFVRDTCSTTHSGTIPITFDDAPSMPSLTRRDTQGSTAKHTAAALQQLTGQSSNMPSRAPSILASPAEEDKAAAASVANYPPDAAHMMAVTEEEMALLEMMRNKRAAMAKDSFTEGYRLALKREQEQMALRRQSAQKTALKILRNKASQDLIRRGSRSELPGLSEDRRLSTLRHENVDNELKLERFLTLSETPLEGQFPSPPMHSRPPSDIVPTMVEHEAPILLPRTYTPLSGGQRVEASPLLPSPSTIGGMSERSRSSNGAAQLQADVSRFLAAGGRADSAAFPVDRHRSLRSTAQDRLQLPSVGEESNTPPIPSRSPSREPHRGDTQPQALDSDAQIAPRAKKGGQYSSFLTPFLDAPTISPFDFPFPFTANATSTYSAPAFDTASLSTSRASPKTPDFTPPGLSVDKSLDHHHHHSTRGVEIAGSETTSSPPRLGSLRQQSSLPQLRGAVTKGAGTRFLKAQRVPPPLLMPGTRGREVSVERAGSVKSVSSATGDVLKAWKELGGGWGRTGE